MNKKKITIIIFALALLIGGVIIVARSVVKKEQVNDVTQNSVLKKKESIRLFGQVEGDDKAREITEISGILEAIGEKTITVKNTEMKAVVVNITGATPVMLANNNNKATIGQMADLRVGDAVKVNYDNVAKNGTMIVVFARNQ